MTHTVWRREARQPNLSSILIYTYSILLILDDLHVTIDKLGNKNQTEMMKDKLSKLKCDEDDSRKRKLKFSNFTGKVSDSATAAIIINRRFDHFHWSTCFVFN